MIRKKHNLFKGSAGILLLVFIALGFFFFFETRNIRESVNTTPPDAVCVSSPDPNHIVTYQNNEYRLIRPNVQIITEEIRYHLLPTTPPKLLVEGANRITYVPNFDDIHGGGVTAGFWYTSDQTKDLLFVDKTNVTPDKLPGYSYFDVYLKPDATGAYTVPDFIKAFCSSQFPVGTKILPPNTDGTTFPPRYFDMQKVTNWQNGDATTVPASFGGASAALLSQARPALEKHFIFSYASEGSPAFNYATGVLWPNGSLSVTSGTTTHTYKVIYTVGTALQYVTLVDTDTNSPDHHIAYIYVKQEHIVGPTPTPQVGSGKNLQLQTFDLTTIPSWAWWNPECKPAIYLYPEQMTAVSVQINPQGYLTHTDPTYPENGWQISASPDGTINSGGKTYPYLYYESKIRDDVIEKPTDGYMVPYQDLSQLYDSVLPDLGLNEKEIADFKAYWNGKLTFAPYYFVGVMKESAIDRIEPLTITPRPDTIERVRLYFQARNALVPVTKPILSKKERHGFTVVEWGGLVKNDKAHPFTCSQ